MLSYSHLFDESLLTESSYEKLAVLESCDAALNEGIFDNRIVTTAASYTYSMIIELLENAKNTLLKLCSVVLSYLNNYILNSAKLVDKYRELLKDRVSKLSEPFSYSYYEYPDSKHYPVVIAVSGSMRDTIAKLQDTIKTKKWTADRVENAVNDLLQDFGRKTVGESVDIWDIKASVTEAVTKHVRGKLDIRILTKDDIDQFANDMKQYRPLVDEIKRTKSDVEKDYKELRVLYEGALKVPTEIKSITKMQTAFDPQLSAMKAKETQRFSDINVQMSRLFNGFITIYNTAFNTKLNLIQERIDINRAVINELLRRTGVIAALATTTPDRYRKPFKYEPSIKT